LLIRNLPVILRLGSHFSSQNLSLVLNPHFPACSGVSLK
jgi:hypothetical protein